MFVMAHVVAGIGDADTGADSISGLRGDDGTPSRMLRRCTAIPPHQRFIISAQTSNSASARKSSSAEKGEEPTYSTVLDLPECFQKCWLWGKNKRKHSVAFAGSRGFLADIHFRLLPCTIQEALIAERYVGHTVGNVAKNKIVYVGKFRVLEPCWLLKKR